MELKIKNKKIVEWPDEFYINSKNDIYMKMMVKALAMVGSEYILCDDIQHSESTSQSEFYYQWRKLLDENNPNGLFLNTDVSKHLGINDANKRPDAILHKSQSNNDDNRIACEIKRQGWVDKNFSKDLNTLNLLLTSANRHLPLEENFKWGVYIQFGGTMSRIERHIKNQSFNDDIWCIVVNKKVTKITIKTIGEMR